jgi:hypothetical protein
MSPTLTEEFPMRVLIVEEESGAGAAAERRLIAAGHTTVSCSDPGMALPCRGLDSLESCPLDEAAVDIAVLALESDERDANHVPPGFVCASRRSVPLVVLGSPDRPEYRSGAAGQANHADDIVAAVEHTATLPLPAHSDAARAAVRDTLDRHDLRDVDASARVERNGGRLHIRVVTSTGIPDAVGQTVAVRALSAVRAVDPTATAVGITIEP